MRWKVKFRFWTDQKLRNSLCGFHGVSNKCNSQRNSILDVTDRENDELYDLEPADPLQNGHLILSINNQRETMVKKKNIQSIKSSQPPSHSTSRSMAQMSKKSKAAAAKAPTGKSALSSSNPKTPVQANGGPKPSGTSKGRPRKNVGKENEGRPVSPLPGAINAASLAPSSDAPTGEDIPTSVADENRVLRERLAKAECKLDVLFSVPI